MQNCTSKLSWYIVKLCPKCTGSSKHRRNHLSVSSGRYGEKSGSGASKSSVMMIAPAALPNLLVRFDRFAQLPSRDRCGVRLNALDPRTLVVLVQRGEQALCAVRHNHLQVRTRL